MFFGKKNYPKVDLENYYGKIRIGIRKKNVVIKKFYKNYRKFLKLLKRQEEKILEFLEYLLIGILNFQCLKNHLRKFKEMKKCSKILRLGVRVPFGTIY
jgi:hypothetical protein